MLDGWNWVINEAGPLPGIGMASRPIEAKERWIHPGSVVLIEALECDSGLDGPNTVLTWARRVASSESMGRLLVGTMADQFLADNSFLVNSFLSRVARVWEPLTQETRVSEEGRGGGAHPKNK